MAKAPQRDGAVEHVLMPEKQRVVVVGRTRVERARALEVVVERGRSTDASWERDGQLSARGNSAKEHLGNRETSELSRIELLDNRIGI